jgi:SAM-dependent methyltransferase
VSDLDDGTDNVRQCPACGSATPFEPLYRVNGSSIARCQTCGLGRADPSGFDPESYYTAEYFSGAHDDGYADYTGSERVLRAEFEKTVASLRNHVYHGRLLEVGCAYGYFLKEAEPHFEVVGIEISQDAVEACHAAGLSNVQQGVVDTEKLDRVGDVDAVVLLDVIEHLPAPVDDLRLLVERLRPGGCLMISTGDFSSLLARWAGPKWRLMTPPQHLWFFTPQAFQHIAEKLGLRIVDLRHPWKTVPLSLLLFQAQRMLGKTPREPARNLLSGVGLPLNLFDAMRVIMRRT